MVLAAMVFIISLAAKADDYKHHNWFASIGIFAVCSLTGYFQGKQYEPELRFNSFIETQENYAFFNGTISKSFSSGDFSKYEVVVEAGMRKGIWEPASGKVMIYSKKHKDFLPGDKILFKNRLQKIKGPSSEYDIDYQKIYASRGFFFQQFISERRELYLFGQKRFSVGRYAYKIHLLLKEKLREALSPLSYSIAAAMLIGDKTNLEYDTRQVFAKSGTMHILAVSGLHVGILYLIIQYIFGFLKFSKNGKILLVAISLLLLWSYAFITGLSSSVLRSSIMFSFFSIAPLINRGSSGINITAFSAFLILLFSPHTLYEIGFQLSYAAVFSILFFYQSIYKLLSPKSYWMDKVWQITSVSIAAQLGTFPIVIYYFNHFQPFFIVFNWIAIPFAFLVLTGGFFFLSVSYLPGISAVTGFLLDVLIQSGTVILDVILTYSPELGHLKINPAQLILIYLLIKTLTAFAANRKLSYWAASCLVLLLVNSTVVGRQVNETKQHELLISTSKTGIVVDIVEGKEYCSWKHVQNPDKSLSQEATRKRYVAGAIEKVKEASRHKTSHYELIVYKGKSYLFLFNPKLDLSPGLHFNYILLNGETPTGRWEYYKKFANNVMYLRNS